jgi:hypothetical protein
MTEEQAQKLADYLEREGAQTHYLAGDMWGVDVNTPFRTPDGETQIFMLIMSDDDGDMYISYEDDLVGAYSDEPMHVPFTVEQLQSVAEFVKINHSLMCEGKLFLPQRFTDGLMREYAAIVEGGE